MLFPLAFESQTRVILVVILIVRHAGVNLNLAVVINGIGSARGAPRDLLIRMRSTSFGCGAPCVRLPRTLMPPQSCYHEVGVGVGIVRFRLW